MKLHPDLLNNSLFLRYYQKWQEEPNSVIFASVAEYFLLYGMPDEAYAVAKEGMDQHPDLISGHLVMAKIHKHRENKELAKDELKLILSKIPHHPVASKMIKELDGKIVVAEQLFEKPAAPHEIETELVSEPDEQLQEDVDEDEYEFKSNDDEEKEEEYYDEEKMKTSAHWQTLTMARIFSSQGHIRKARRIYQAILDKEPENAKAREGLNSLGERV
ncbi:MAG: hypothetical protein ABIE74_05245 [Pseudomonadota bacterium]